MLFALAATLAAAFPPADTPIPITDRSAVEAEVLAEIDASLDDLLALYRTLHRNPELSLHETGTAKRAARVLKRAGYRVTANVGGTGVVAVLARGDGPTILLRADMDALPITEATGVDWASTNPGVMHACGHDVHVTSAIGAAQTLANRDDWRGTLVVILQPAEELGKGARAMIADGLFERFPEPDHAISVHVGADVPAGVVRLTPGFANANVDMVDVVFHGRGGHGARPHQAIDPIAIGATFVTAVQTVVSRRLDPQDPGVITVGSFHAGTKHNVIPDDAALQLTVRSYSDDVRAQLLDGIRDVAAGTCAAMLCTAPPDITVRDEFTPSAYNHPGLTEAASAILGRALGDDAVQRGVPTMGGEDFGRYSRELDIPGLQMRIGAAPADRFDENGQPTEPLPSLHSPRFAPDAAPTVRTATAAMALVALGLFAS